MFKKLRRDKHSIQNCSEGCNNHYLGYTLVTSITLGKLLWWQNAPNEKYCYPERTHFSVKTIKFKTYHRGFGLMNCMAKFNVKEELLYFTTFINLIMPANKTLYPSNCVLESLQITFSVTQSFLSFLSFLSLWILGFVNLFSYLSGRFCQLISLL